MNFNFKKIASALASTAMIGSTIALAAAASYPAPFVKSGVADVAVVYGSNAASSDSLAALKVGQSLQSSMSGGAVMEDAPADAYPLFTSSTEIYLNDSINVARSALTTTEMPVMLADGDFSGNVDTEFTQIITFLGNSRVLFGQQPTNDDDPQVFVNIGTSSASPIYNASVTFDQAVNFNSTDSKGESLNLFGKEWTIGTDTDADTIVLYQSSERIALSLGGSSPNPSSTVTADGVSYTVELVAASDTSATIRVTDSAGNQQTREIDEDDSRKVNGLEIAVAFSDESEATGVVSAEITVGSQKILLENGQNVKVGADEDSLDGTIVSFNGANLGALTKLTFSVFSDDTDEDALVTGGAFADPIFGNFKLYFGGLSSSLDSTDRDMIAVSNSGDDIMTVKMTNHAGDQETVRWAVNSSNGNGAALHLAYGDQGNELIRVREGAQLNKSMYVVVGNQDEGYLLRLKTTTNSSSDTQDTIEFEDVFDTSRTYKASITSEGVGTVTVGGRTYDLTYTGASTDSSNINVRLNYPDSTGANVVVYPTIETEGGAKVSFYEPVTIDLNDYNGAGTDATGIMIPDGDDYATTVAVALSGTQGGFTVGGTLLNSTITTSVLANVGNLTYNFTYSGLNTTKIYLLNTAGGVTPAGNIFTPAMLVWEEEEDRTNAFNALVVKLTPQQGTDDIELNEIMSTSAVASTASGNNDGNDYIALDSDDDLSQLLTTYGTLVTIDNPSSGAKTATISYPDDQVQAMLYIGESSSSSSGSSLGGISVTDAELSSVSSKNLVVVGGSCINTVAATLLGSSSPLCGADFTAKTGVSAGQYLIQSFQSPYASNKVATLVAGYDADGTTNAATFFTTQSPTTAAGTPFG